jgi:hypothetical protein
MGRTCRSIVNRGCKRCTKRIKTQNKEEIGKLLRVIHACRRRQSAAVEMHRRGKEHRRDMVHKA